MKDLDFTGQLHNIVDDYFSEITYGVNQVCKRKSKELAEKISQDSPKKSGEYKKGWKSTLKEKNGSDETYTVYQKAKPSLTHLLEYGHISTDGKRVFKGGAVVGKKPHIDKNADTIINETYSEIEEAIKNASS